MNATLSMHWDTVSLHIDCYIVCKWCFSSGSSNRKKKLEYTLPFSADQGRFFFCFFFASGLLSDINIQLCRNVFTNFNTSFQLKSWKVIFVLLFVHLLPSIQGRITSKIGLRSSIRCTCHTMPCYHVNWGHSGFSCPLFLFYFFNCVGLSGCHVMWEGARKWELHQHPNRKCCLMAILLRYG